jgi:hypothetical protein
MLIFAPKFQFHPLFEQQMLNKEEFSNKMDEPMIQISVVSIEHTMEKPHPHLDYTVSKFFNGRQVQRVPVVHIYGSTSAGQVCCLIFLFFAPPSIVNYFLDQSLVEMLPSCSQVPSLFPCSISPTTSR